MTENLRAQYTEQFNVAVADIPDACLPFVGILVEALELHTRKSKDYGSGADPYENCRASEGFGIPSWTGVAMRMADKIRRIQAFSRNGFLANEGVEDSFIDLVVYGTIGLMLVREKNTNKEVRDMP